MIFSHQSHPYTASHLLFSFVDQLNKLTPSSHDTYLLQNHSDLLSFFLPSFQEADQILKELYEAGICDIQGEPCSPFNFQEMPSLSFECKEAEASIQAIADFLTKSRQVEIASIGAYSASRQFHIPIVFYSLLSKFIELGYCTRSRCNENGTVEFLPPCPIEDIQLIGSFVLELLQAIPFLHAAKEFFGSRIPEEKIEQWFKMAHIERLFSKKAQDHDLRILSSGSLEDQAYFSDLALRYLADSIENFDSSFYIEQLKSRHSKYQNLDNQIQHTSIIKKFSILEFGGVTKRNLVNLPKTQYTILGIKTCEDRPTDFLFVGLKNGKPTLENLNLSTTNCWTVSIFNLLNHSQKRNLVLKINAQPFTAAKALIDILCDISTVKVPNVSAWSRFLRDCGRSLQPLIQHEQAMLQAVFRFKEAFLKEKRQIFTPSEKISNGTYICLLLEEEIKKSQMIDHQVNPYGVIPLLFRACQSLAHVSFSDQEYATLWNLANDREWLWTENSSTDPEKITCMAIKKALINEKVPFNVVSAWLGMLAWIYAPLSASSHCQQPVFYLKFPLLCLLPIQPIENGKILHMYFAHHPCPASFQDLYHIMASNHTASIASFPLIPYFSQLKIDVLDLKQLSDQWLAHSSSLLNVVGAQLYLSIASLIPDKFNLALIFKHLPFLLQAMAHPQQMQELIKALDRLAGMASPGYQRALQQAIQAENLPLKSHRWISLLTETKDPEILLLAYTLWKEDENGSPQFARRYAKIGWSLYTALCSYNPHLALSLLQTLHRSHGLDFVEDEFKGVLNLIQAYQIHAPQQLICDLDRLLPFLYSIFERGQEKPLEFKDKEQQQAFSQALILVIEGLYQLPFKQTTADYFLLEASRKGYINRDWQTQTWLERLEKLISQPGQVTFAFSYYQVVAQEKLLYLSAEMKGREQQLQIALGEALLANHCESLSLALLEKFVQKELENTQTSLSYQWVLRLFQTQVHASLEECHWPILNLLLLLTPSHKRDDSQLAFFQFFAHVVKSMQSMSDASPLLKHSLTILDEFLGKEELIPLMNRAIEEWQGLLLDYLEASFALIPCQRFSALWQIYMRLMHLFKKTRKTNDLLRLFKVLSSLFEHSPDSYRPNATLLEWIKMKHQTILDKFYHHKCVQEAKHLLLALNRYQLVHQSLARYIWWISQHELYTSSSPLPLLNLETFDNLCAAIQPESYSHLPKLLSVMLRESSVHSSQAYKWINWCLSLPDQEKFFQQAEMVDIYLTGIEQLIKDSQFTQAFHLLRRLSHLTELQHQKACSNWIQITVHLYSSCSVEISRQLFLNSQICSSIEDQLHPFIPILIQRHLSTSVPSRLEKNLTLDLLQTYAILAVEPWLAFWKSLELKMDADLIPSVWETYKIRAPSLKGSCSELAHCWILALTLLKQIHHPDLLTCFHHQEWLNIFSDPSITHLKWQALEAVHLGAINHLSPIVFDAQFFELILQSKLKITSTILAERAQEAMELNEWNIRLEFALIEHLQNSSDYVCLSALCPLLESLLPVCTHDHQLYITYLSHFQKFVSAYSALNPPPDKMQIHQFIFDFIIKSLETIAYLDQMLPISGGPFVRFLFERANSHLHLEIAINLISKSLNEGKMKKKEREELKSLFLSLMARLINSTSDEVGLKQINCYLKQFFNLDLMELTLINKCVLSKLFMQASFTYQVKNTTIENKVISDALTLYVEWAPYLFAQSNALKEMLNTIVWIIIPYASSTLSYRLDKDQFIHALTQILDIKYQVKLSSAQVYQESLQSYFAWVINAIKALNPRIDFLVEALNTYITKMIAQAQAHQISAFEVIQLLNEFAQLYPPQPEHIILFENCILDNSLIDTLCYQSMAKKLLKKAIHANLFQAYPNELISLNLEINFQILDIEFKESQYPLFGKIIEKLLNYGTSYSIFRAIQLCSLLQNLFAHSHEIDILLTYCRKILHAIQPYSKCWFRYDETNHTSLIDYLDLKTLTHFYKANSQLKLYDFRYQSSILRYKRELSTLYLQFVLDVMKDLVGNQTDMNILIHYLFKSFHFLRLQAAFGNFEGQYKTFLALLKQLLPLVRYTAIKNEGQLSQNGEIVSSTILVKEWIECLLYTQHLTKNGQDLILKVKEKRQQSTLIFECLRILNNEEEGDNASNRHDSIFIALMSIIKHKNYWFNPQQQDAILLFKHIRQMLDTYPHMATIKRFTFELVSYEFHKNELEKNYFSLLETVSRLIKLLSEINILLHKKEMNYLHLLFRAVLKLLEQEESYSSEKQDLLLRLLVTLQPFFEDNSLLPTHIVTSNFLMKILEKGVDQKLLTEDNPTAKNYYEWTLRWVEISCPAHHIPARLLDLIFYQNSCSHLDLQTYQKSISAIIPGLCAFLVEKKDWTYAQRFVYLITRLPISQKEQFVIFIEWIQTVSQLLVNLQKEKKEIEQAYQEIYRLALDLQAQHFFDNVEILLNLESTPTLTNSSVKTLIDYFFYHLQFRNRSNISGFIESKREK